MRRLLLFCICFTTLAVVAQTPTEPEVDGYSKRLSELGAALANNPSDVETLYGLALFYFDNSNPMRNLPVAMQYIQKTETNHIALLNDNRISELTKLVKKGIDLNAIRQTKQAIAEAARRKVKSQSNMGWAEMDIYQDVFGSDPEVVRSLRQRRFNLAYREDLEAGTAESYYHFMTRYPGTNEAEQMESRLAELVPALYATVLNEAEADSIADRYRMSPSVTRAATRCKSRLAYAEACRHNTITAYNSFLRRYPASDEQMQARERLDALLDAKYYTLSTALEYADFADSNYDNPLADSALAEIRRMVFDNHDAAAARLYVERFKHDAYYSQVYNLYYSWHAAEGNRAPILRFDEDNPDFPSPMAIESDLERSQRIDMLNLMESFAEWKMETYTMAIRRQMDKRIAFVMMQRTLQQLLLAGNYPAAQARATQFELCFESVSSDEYNELLRELATPHPRQRKTLELSAAYDVLNPVVNTSDGHLYFTRRDSTGLSICSAVRDKGRWTAIKPVQFTNATNEGLTIFGFYANGARMLLGSDGDIWLAERDGSGWRVSDIPSYPVNTDFIETDAYMLPDGSGIILASDRPGGYNMQLSGDYFHGDTALATDLYYIPYTQSGWGTPVNLGLGVNTSYCERSPLLGKNQKVLYYVTDARGFGYGDIYMVTRDNTADWTSWGKPRNIGREINGPLWEQSLSFGNGERKLYFSSKNANGKYECYSTDVWHDTVDVSGTYLLDVADVEGNLTRVRVADMGSQEVIRQNEYQGHGDAVEIKMHRGRRYVVLGDAGFRFVPALVVSSADAGKQHMRGYTFVELVAMDKALPLPAITFASGKAQLGPVARLQLEQLAQFASHQERCGMEIVVNVAGRDDMRCFNLSLARGNAVRDYLAACGLDVSTVTVSPYGNLNMKKGAVPEVSVRFRESY